MSYTRVSRPSGGTDRPGKGSQRTGQREVQEHTAQHIWNDRRHYHGWR